MLKIAIEQPDGSYKFKEVPDFWPHSTEEMRQVIVHLDTHSDTEGYVLTEAADEYTTYRDDEGYRLYVGPSSFSVAPPLGQGSWLLTGQTFDDFLTALKATYLVEEI